MLLRNAQRDGRKGGKFQSRWLGPYAIHEYLGKGVYKLANRVTGRVLKKAVNVCLLKVYNDPVLFHDESSQHLSHDNLLSLHSSNGSHDGSRDGLQSSHDHSQSSCDRSQSSHGCSQLSHNGSQSSHCDLQSSFVSSQDTLQDISHESQPLRHGHSSEHSGGSLKLDGAGSPTHVEDGSFRGETADDPQGEGYQILSFQEEFQGNISLDGKLYESIHYSDGFATSSFLHEGGFFPNFFPQHESSLSPIKMDVQDLNGMSAYMYQ